MVAGPVHTHMVGGPVHTYIYGRWPSTYVYGRWSCTYVYGRWPCKDTKNISSQYTASLSFFRVYVQCDEMHHCFINEGCARDHVMRERDVIERDVRELAEMERGSLWFCPLQSSLVKTT